MRHEFKSETGRWILVVDDVNGFYLYDSNDEEGSIVLDASTLFSHENAWIEILDGKLHYDRYFHVDDKHFSTGLRLKDS